MSNIILTQEEFDKIINIINSDLSDREKAVELGEIMYYADLYSMFSNNFKFKTMLKIFNREDLEKIYAVYATYDEKNFFRASKKSYKCDVNELRFRLDTINKIDELLKKESTDVEKINILVDNFNDIEEFKKKYTLLLKHGKNDERLDRSREALNNFDYILGILESLPKLEVENAIYRRNLIDYLEKNNYLDNYLCAENIIKSFISSDLIESDFINKIGIDETSMKYSEGLISFINPNLFHQYTESIKTKEKMLIQSHIDAIKNIDHGIKTGFLKDGKEFDILDFYRLIPFKDSLHRFRYVLSSFICKNIENGEEVYRTIAHYMNRYNLAAISILKENDIFGVDLTINGVVISDAIKRASIKYMEINKFPMFNNVFKIVVRKYANGELDLNELNLFEEKEEIKCKIKIKTS